MRDEDVEKQLLRSPDGRRRIILVHRPTGRRAEAVIEREEPVHAAYRRLWTLRQAKVSATADG